MQNNQDNTDYNIVKDIEHFNAAISLILRMDSLLKDPQILKKHTISWLGYCRARMKTL